MKLSSIIIPATLFGVGWASRILPKSHPCSDICQPSEVSCDNRGLEGFFDCACKAYRPLIKDCGNCLNKHSPKKHRSLEEVALILALRLTATLCPDVEPGLISTLPKLGKGALAKALDKTTEFFGLLAKIFGHGHWGSVASAAASMNAVMPPAAASMTTMMPSVAGSDERHGGPAAVVHYGESLMWSTVAARETVAPFDPAQAIDPSHAARPAEDVAQTVAEGPQSAEATAGAAAGADTAYTEEAMAGAEGAEATAPAMAPEETFMDGDAMASQAATAVADAEDAFMTAEATAGGEAADEAVFPETAGEVAPEEDGEIFASDEMSDFRNETLDDINQTLHGRPSDSGNMSIPESTQRVSLGNAAAMMAPKALMAAVVIIGLWPAF
ncbi:hypothetical protein ESCO_006141 [Escovopsis weberi]|uniref:Uncharacterized protein n=1 Tax=Escovopsis weberi TaxID=150374 RepID=A0A0M8N524_ESCWE|nr:hypothetical protein ESCO_006141 [Escovopsis weberi]